MLEGASTGLREIWRRICLQISRPHLNPSLPLPVHPRGRVSGAVPGTFQLPPEPQRALLDELIAEILSRLPQDADCRERGARVIAKLSALVGDLPASADHHHSDRFGLLQHSLEVALKMMEESKAIPVRPYPPDGSASGVDGPGNAPRWRYLCFLAGVCHDLGKLFEMDVREGQRQWCPLNQTYADFLREAKANPVMRWRKDRVRGAHAMFSPSLVHHILSRADFEYIDREGLVHLVNAIVDTHNGGQSALLVDLLRKLDQESVEEAAPDWMLKRADSKVNQFVRALRTLIERGELGVNSFAAPVYVAGNKAAVVVPAAIQLARDFLKQENVTLPGNIHLYDLLSQSRLVEADEGGRCVRRIKVRGWHGPVELSALIFTTETIVPKQMIATLPNFSFEIKPEEHKHGNGTADAGKTTSTTTGDPFG
jgi:Putative helicase